ncbi:MAG: RNA 3'-terminal phosphate cyclase [Spirochaetota bacterium]
MVHIHATTYKAARQALALSLVLQKACTITIDSSLLSQIYYNRHLEDIVSVLKQLSLDIRYSGGSITVNPSQLPALTATITLNQFCPVTDIFLTIAPALSCNTVQSDIQFTGVTHCHYTYSTGFVRFGLAPLLSRFGCFVHMATKKFGFYTATGNATAKVYPHTHKEMDAIVTATRITHVRIYIANIDQEFAFYQKKELCTALSISEDIASIMQVANVTNHGSAIDVFFTTGDIPSMLSFIMPLYDDTGNFIFNDAMMHEFLSTVITTCMHSYEYIPLPVVEEVLPFLAASGLDCTIAEKLNPNITKTESYSMCKALHA